MAKLSDLKKVDDWVKILLLGPSGAGKTVLAADFADPIKWFDFDMKISSAASFYSNQPEKLEQIDYSQYGQLQIKDRMRSFLAETKSIDELVYAKKPLPFKTVVLDSLTTMTAMILEDYKKVSQLGIKRALEDVNAMQDYQLLQIHVLKIITGLLALPCNVVIIGHTQLEKDETSGAIKENILMPGQLASKLPIYFEEVYKLKLNSKGERVLQTASDSKIDLRNQRKLPAEIPASFAEIVKVR